MSLPADPAGRELLRLLYREQAERSLATETAAVLKRGLDAVVTKLVLGGDELSSMERRRLQDLLDSLTRELTSAYRAARELTTAQLGRFGEIEARATLGDVAAAAELAGATRMVQETLSAETTVALAADYARAVARLPVMHLPFGDWWTAQATQMDRRVRATIQTGLITGAGNARIAAALIRERVAVGPAGSATELAAAWPVARRDIHTLVRTASTAVASRAQRDVAASLPGVVALRMRATLDARTSLICAAKDGTVVRVEDAVEGVTIPPFHMNCRTVTEAVFDPALGMPEPARTAAGDWSRYEAWLRTQTVGVQNAILGPSRASLWRSGSLSLAQLISSDNRVLTLDQLAERLDVQLATAVVVE